MLRLGLFPFVRPALAFAVGITVYEFLLRAFAPLLWPLGGLFLTCCAVWAVVHRLGKPNDFRSKPIKGIVLLAIWASLGSLWTGLYDESRKPNHLLNLQAPLQAWQGVVEDGLTRRPSYTATTVRLRMVKRADGTWQRVNGRIRLMIRRENAQHQLAYGDVVVVKGAPHRVAEPMNPGQFDYAAYQRYRQIWHEQFVRKATIRVVGREALNPLVGISLSWSGKIETVLRRYVDLRREAGLLVALVLGVSDDVAADLKIAYGATGTTHVLAVSGLHIGLVFSIILWVVGGNNWHRRRPAQRWAIVGLLLMLIWTYALLTGLSASVLRAVVMTSLVIIGRAFHKRISLFNTLAIAALGILIYNPFSLFDVGFQLSFLAVFSIVYLQSRLADLWYPQAWLPRVVWQAVTVALAAQLGTAPLTLYYFHQFPTQFLLANLIAVPWSNMLLYAAFALLALAGLQEILMALGVGEGFLEMTLQGWGWLLGHATYWLNESVAWIGRLPAAVITGIWLTPAQMLLLYALLLSTLVWLRLRTRGWLIFSVGLVALYVGSRISIMIQTTDDRLLTVYSIKKHAAISLLDGASATILADSAIWCDSAAGANGLRANILPQLWMRATRQAFWLPLLSRDSLSASPPGTALRRLPDGNRLLGWHGVKLLLLDRAFSLKPAPGQRPLSVDYVLVHGKPRFVAKALMKAVACRVIVFDGSGPPGWSRRRAESLRRAGYRVHLVADDGAFQRVP